MRMEITLVRPDDNIILYLKSLFEWSQFVTEFYHFEVTEKDPEYEEIYAVMQRLAKRKEERVERAKLCELKRKYGDIDCE